MVFHPKLFFDKTNLQINFKKSSLNCCKFDQQTASIAPIHWSKYTAFNVDLAVILNLTFIGTKSMQNNINSRAKTPSNPEVSQTHLAISI